MTSGLQNFHRDWIINTCSSTTVYAVQN